MHGRNLLEAADIQLQGLRKAHGHQVTWMALAEASFDASWPWYLDLSSTTEPSFVSCLSLQCCSLQETRGKLKVWRGLFHTHLQGRIGGWDAFNKLLFLALERGCLFLYIWGRLVSFGKNNTETETSTVTGHRAWRTCQETEEKHLKAFCAFLIWVWFSICLFISFFMTEWKSCHIN